MYKTKQIILYRRDLKMRKGKIAAQVAHASMAVFFNARIEPEEVGLNGPVLVIPCDVPMWEWVTGSFAKVVLSVEDEASLLMAHELAKQAGLPTSLITDQGRTEFHGVPTNTTVAIGPAPVEDIDKITGPNGVLETKLA